MLFRNRLIFGIVKKILSAIFKVIYKIISAFNLQLPVLIGLVGLVLFFTGVLDSTPVLWTVVALALVISIAFSIMSFIKKILGLNKVSKKKKGVHIMKEPKAEETLDEKDAQDFSGVTLESERVDTEKPRYYKVKNKPSYVMAEYSDKYVLYKINEGRLEEVRRDVK